MTANSQFSPMNLMISPTNIWFPGNIFRSVIVEKDTPHLDTKINITGTEILVLLGIISLCAIANFFFLWRNKV